MPGVGGTVRERVAERLLQFPVVTDEVQGGLPARLVIPGDKISVSLGVVVNPLRDESVAEAGNLERALRLVIIPEVRQAHISAHTEDEKQRNEDKDGDDRRQDTGFTAQFHGTMPP